jgi:hypothetical protein
MLRAVAGEMCKGIGKTNISQCWLIGGFLACILVSAQFRCIFPSNATIGALFWKQHAYGDRYSCHADSPEWVSVPKGPPSRDKRNLGPTPSTRWTKDPICCPCRAVLKGLACLSHCWGSRDGTRRVHLSRRNLRTKWNSYIRKILGWLPRSLSSYRPNCRLAM